jgi:hypothetical protein
MTPKEKANELVDKFYQTFPLTMDLITTIRDLSWEYDSWNEAKQCALIAVDEIIEAGKDVDEFANVYWYKVKAEIDNL